MHAARLVSVLLIVGAVSAAGCRGGQTATPDETTAAPTTATAAAPGEGTSVADEVFEAAGFRGGETMAKTATETLAEPASATSRVSAALAGHPTWELAGDANPSSGRDGDKWVVTYSFADGSVLRLVGSPGDSIEVSRLESVEVERR